MQNSTTWFNLFLTASKYKLVVKPPIKIWIIAVALSVVLTWFIWQLPIVKLLLWQQLSFKLLILLIPVLMAVIAVLACRQNIEYFYLDPQKNSIGYQQQSYQIERRSKVSTYFCYLVLQNQQYRIKRLIWRQGCQPKGYAMLARMIRANMAKKNT